MKQYPEIKDSDKVYPLKYSDSRNCYRIPHFIMPSKLGWLREHCERELYIRELDVGIYEIGSLRGGKVPNAKKIKVLCPYHEERYLEAVDSRTLFCGECAPHKYVKNGEILKKIIHLIEHGEPICEIPEDK